MPQCQFLFSAVFGFRKAVLQIFSELDETNCHAPIFPGSPRSQEGKCQGGPWAPPHAGARQGPQARRPMGREPWTSTDVAPSPIYSSRLENPKITSHIPERVPQRRRHRRQVSGDRSLCSGTLPGRGSAPGAISIDSIAIFIAAADSHDEEGVVLPRG